MQSSPENGLALRVLGLSVDYIDCPLGLENPRPRLAWKLESSARNVRQAAYRILVGTTPESISARRADLWDSGRVHWRSSVGVEYDGLPLRSRQRCYWSVQVWTDRGQASPWSETKSWEMGLLCGDDWKAEWLSVDDDLARGDRNVPVWWMWDQLRHADEAVREFKLSFNTSQDCRGGVLFAGVTGDTRVVGIFIDGKSQRVSGIPQQCTRERVELEPMGRGEHLVKVAVERNRRMPRSVPGTKAEDGLAVVMRLEFLDGTVLRHASGPDWLVGVAGSITDDVCAAGIHVQARRSDGKLVVVDPAMNLRKEFTVAGGVVRARLYVTALGSYEARLNGNRVGDALLSPEVSQYDKRLLYRVYDVGKLLRLGLNAIGLTVGDGWYAGHPGRYSWGPPPRRVIGQLELTRADGAIETIITNEEWKISRSAILRSELCSGEIYDGRLAQEGWDMVGFDDARWNSIRKAEVPSCELVSQITPPIRATSILRARTVTEVTPQVYVFDFGQNCAGWCRLRTVGSSGTRVHLLFGELLKSGQVDQSVMRGDKAADTYILRGDPQGEVFEPHFVYHGFRYVQVTGLEAKPSEDTVEAIVINTDLRFTGSIEVDNPLIGRIWRNALWGQRSNFVGIPTDCPNRAERLGWMGDAGVFWDAASFNMDVATFTRRQMDNVRDTQDSNGAFQMFAPGSMPADSYECTLCTAPGWGEGGIILPWMCWQRYGDVDIIEQNWKAMNRHVQFIHDNNPDFLWKHARGFDFGDWLAVGDSDWYGGDDDRGTPKDLIATAYWAHATHLLSQMAHATGRRDDAARLRTIHDRVRTAFSDAFVRSTGEVGNGTQTCYILALAFHLLPAELRQLAIGHLIRNICERDHALSTGILGTQHSLDVLAESGHVRLAYDILLRTRYPSWGFMIENGATTMWERWDGNLDNTTNEGSHNHYMFGSVCGFIFRRMAGIDAEAPAFAKIVVHPLPDPRVKRVTAQYESIIGPISTAWSQGEDSSFSLIVSVPANSEARIHLPATRDSSVSEGGRQICGHPDVHVHHRSATEVVVKVGSGQYKFLVRDCEVRTQALTGGIAMDRTSAG
jgi:alpha-L-rhamnosidase